MQKLCTALVIGNRGAECMEPVAEGAQISLCALHLLLAAQTVEELGRPHLVSLVKKGK